MQTDTYNTMGNCYRIGLFKGLKTQRRERGAVLADMMDYLSFEGCKQDFQRVGGSISGK